MSANPFPAPETVRHGEFSVLGSLRLRILASLALVTGWVSFTLLYVAFWATGFTLFQSVIVVIVSLVILTACLVGAWVSFGFGYARRWLD